MKSIKLETNKLFKIYKRGDNEVMALNGISEKFYTGEIVGIFGPSGCGKSTFLNIIGSLDSPSFGDVIFYPPSDQKAIFRSDQVQLSKLSADKLAYYRNQSIGIVFQFLNLLPHLTVEENIEYPLLMNRNYNPTRMSGKFPSHSDNMRKARIKELLELVKLDHMRTKFPDELSGGEQQKIAICTALINRPSIILADEPTGELDSKSTLMILQLFQDLAKLDPELLILIVSHNDIVKSFTSRNLEMKDGTFLS